jgi:uncharacterized protein (DUF488 family)
MTQIPTRPSALYSIGYEKAAFADVLLILQSHGITRIIDVRDLPLSRRPGFSKRQLAAGLQQGGIDYVHLRALGTPPAGREANRRRQWSLFWEIVEAKLASTEAERDLHRAADLALEAPSCLLCYEADYCICHRRRVGDILSARHGFELRHLTVHAPP